MKYRMDNEMCAKTIDAITDLTLKYMMDNNIHYMICGSSGGLDSAITLKLARIVCEKARACGYMLTIVGVTMPCLSNPESYELGKLAIEDAEARHIHVDLSDVFRYMTGDLDWIKAFGCEIGSRLPKRLSRMLKKALRPTIPGVDEQIKQILCKTGGQIALNGWDWSAKMAQGNIRARLRMIIVYHIARMMGGIVLSTDNLSEFWMSFWTICGDVGDFGMIQNVMKGRELNAIARYLKVIPRIIAARPDDGLDIAGGDEDQIGANYPTVDDIMVYLRNHGFDPDGLEDQMKDLPSIPGIPDEQRDKVALRALRGAYKRHGTYVLARDQIYLPSIMSIE